MNLHSIDIETAPLLDDKLAALCPPFDAASVKHGNTVDPMKRAAKIEAARASHLADFIDGAALDARYASVACVSWHDSGGTHLLVNDPDAARLNGIEPGDYTVDACAAEHLLLASLFQAIDEAQADAAASVSRGPQSIAFCGYNNHVFDWPFIIRRAWILGVTPNPMLGWLRGRSFAPPSLDLRERWQLGDRDAHSGGLGGLARSLGVGDKTGSGKDWHKLYERDPQAALEYAANDAKLTFACAERMIQ